MIKDIFEVIVVAQVAPVTVFEEVLIFIGVRKYKCEP